ncbi:MAG: ATP-binding protein, partial [Gammaproteobacteria bacterium]|nr:ATP-binding protein [Gammaproteobacteria bacterium]
FINRFKLPYIISSTSTESRIINFSQQPGYRGLIFRPIDLDNVKNTLERALDFTSQLKSTIGQSLEALASSLIQNREFLQRKLLEEAEQKRQMTRYLHDEASSIIVKLKSNLYLLFRSAQKGDLTKVEELYETQLEQFSQIENALRQVQLELRPAILDSAGLEGAINATINEYVRTHYYSKVHTDVDVNLDSIASPYDLFIYHIVKECVLNIWKHSRATEVTVRVELANAVVHIEVIDNGSGFDSNKVIYGHGLISMREETISLGGELQITSVPDEGTTVQVKLPIVVSNPVLTPVY